MVTASKYLHINKTSGVIEIKSLLLAPATSIF